MSYRHDSSPAPADRSLQLDPLHIEFSIRQALDLKRDLCLCKREMRVVQVQEDPNDIDLASFNLFAIGIPSASQMKAVTVLPEDHPKRAALDSQIRSELAQGEQGLGILSIRPDDQLSVSMNLGLGGTEPDVTVLFGDSCYRVTLNDSELTFIERPVGLFSFLPQSDELRSLRACLPDVRQLTRLDGLTGYDLRAELPEFSAHLAEILNGPAYLSENPLTLVMGIPFKDDLDITIELRFETNEQHELEAFHIVGPSSWHSGKLTLRMLRDALPSES